MLTSPQIGCEHLTQSTRCNGMIRLVSATSSPSCFSLTVTWWHSNESIKSTPAFCLCNLPWHPKQTFAHGPLPPSWLSTCFFKPNFWTLFPYNPLHGCHAFLFQYLVILINLFNFHMPLCGVIPCLHHTKHQKSPFLSNIIIPYNTIHLNNLIWILKE